MSIDAESSVYALLTDGTTVEIRPAGPDDSTRYGRCTRELSPDSLYLRFFSMSPRAATREAERVCRPRGPDDATLLALLDGQVIGVGSYERDSTASLSAEVAFTVADGMTTAASGCCCWNT